MASTMAMAGTRSTSSRNRKRKKTNQMNQINQNQPAAVPWKSEVQQQVYSSKLLHALQHLQINSPSVPKRGRAVREAAYRVLAVTAKGRTRWSRAILTNRLKIKFMKKTSNKRVRKAPSIVATTSRLSKKGRPGILRLKAKNLPAVQRKVKVLSRLVPGCKKEAMPVVLEEASDYIAALQMQVRAMSALADLLSGGSMAASSSSEVGSFSQLGSSQPL